MGARKSMTTQAVKPMTEREQKLALKRIALGDSWKAFVDEIEGKIEDYEPEHHVRQACERALQYMADTAVEI